MLDVNGKESDSLDAVDPEGQVTQMFKRIGRTRKIYSDATRISRRRRGFRSTTRRTPNQRLEMSR